MDRALAKIPPNERTPSVEDKIFTEIMGPETHGRVRTYGCGPTPTEIFGSSSSSSTLSGPTPPDRIKQMIENEVIARMAEYEARREKEIEARMAEYEKRRNDETTNNLKQMLESLGFEVPSSHDSPLKVHSSVGQVPSTDGEPRADDGEPRADAGEPRTDAVVNDILD